jgi:hypothetical protein
MPPGLEIQGSSMRTLLVAAAVVLCVSTAQAQDAADRALPATPSATLVEQLKAAGELKDPKALEAPAPKIDSIETRAEAKPAEQPVVAKPAEATTPAAPAPTAAAPAAAPAVPAATAAAKPAEAKAAEAKPVQAATEAKPAKKRVVRKRETDEQKARRIAAKYGVSW